MRELAGNLELRFHLFDETVVLLLVANNVLEGVNLARLGVVDRVDGTTRTFSQTLQHLILEELLSHELQTIPENVISRSRWMDGGKRKKPKVGDNRER
jgi:hypothetical protein